MLDGRVKTLHPKVHGGLLYIRGNREHEAAVAAHGIQPIDMVVVNLYAFEKTAAQPGVAFGHLIENIDIGGPSMVRSAAKNFEDVAIVTRVADYPDLIQEMKSAGGAASAAKPAGASPDRPSPSPPPTTPPSPTRSTASPKPPRPKPPPSPTPTACPPPSASTSPSPSPSAMAKIPTSAPPSTPTAPASASPAPPSSRARNSASTTSSISTPAGSWRRNSAEPGRRHHQAHQPLRRGHRRNRRSRPTRKLSPATPSPPSAPSSASTAKSTPHAAEEIAKLFVEAIAAPAFTPEARERFAAKKNLRLVEVHSAPPRPVVKHVSGGLLLQDADTGRVTEAELEVVTWRPPTAEELRSLLFAWRVCKHVKSNAIVYARDGQTVGIGAGQMSRVDAARFGAQKAVLPLQGSVAASDAFFPFPDGLEVVAAAGATAVIQPGGSVKDQDVIAAADKLGLAMVFTGIRHFRH